MGGWIFFGKSFIVYKTLMVTRFHCMLLGAVGAMLYMKNSDTGFIRFISNRWIQGATWVIFGLIFFQIIHLPAPVSAEITALISLFMVIGQVNTNVPKLINLENKILDFLGKISYGIYVIHPLIIVLLSVCLEDFNLPILWKSIVVYSLVTVITIALAYISYEYFEKKFLLKKDKYSIVKSSNTKTVSKC